MTTTNFNSTEINNLPMFFELDTINKDEICRRDAVKGGGWTLVKIESVNKGEIYGNVTYRDYNPENGLTGMRFTTHCYKDLGYPKRWRAETTVSY